MMNTPQILLLLTGGTISSAPSSDGLVPTNLTGLIGSILEPLQLPLAVTPYAVCSLDSTDLGPDIWLALARVIEEQYDDYDGFVICHGTDTLSYTAAALSYLIQNNRKPIVLTGVQQPIEVPQTDALTNLSDALIYAANPQSAGVSVVFHHNVISGTHARKIRTLNYDAFTSLNAPLTAVIDQAGPHFQQPPLIPGQPLQFYHTLNTRVFLLSVTPGMDGTILKPLLEQYDALILETFGSGGLAANLLTTLQSLTALPALADKLIVISTQVPCEGTHLMTYEVGTRIKKACSCLEAGTLTREATLTKLMWILAQNLPDFPSIEHAFYTPVSGDC